jgi:hypothetical protein
MDAAVSRLLEALPLAALAYTAAAGGSEGLLCRPNINELRGPPPDGSAAAVALALEQLAYDDDDDSAKGDRFSSNFSCVSSGGFGVDECSGLVGSFGGGFGGGGVAARARVCQDLAAYLDLCDATGCHKVELPQPFAKQLLRAMQENESGDVAVGAGSGGNVVLGESAAVAAAAAAAVRARGVKVDIVFGTHHHTKSLLKMLLVRLFPPIAVCASCCYFARGRNPWTS